MLSVAVIVLLVVGVGLGFGRERIVEGISRVPRPRPLAAAAVSIPVEPTPGTRSVSEARRLSEGGDVTGALRLLRSIPREDPAFPAAERLRVDLESARGAEGGRK
jgi:hypothetical protein